jgi:hypothetical protein
MLRRIPEPLALSEASLLAFRPALNTPVLNVEFMPVGPARAAIVVFAEEYGGIGLGLGIRSIEGGQIAVYRNREPLDEGAVLAEVFEPALAAAERLGFLFDEDMIDGMPSDQGRSQAMALWGQLMGDVEVAVVSTAVQPLETPTPEAIEPILDLDEPLAAEPAAPEVVLEEVVAVEPTQTVSLMQTLSRFRHSAVAKKKSSRPVVAKPKRSDKKKEGGANTLGRIPLVRVRRGRDGSSRVPYLVRLLSSF